jgi:dTDP-4-amino-4,6-dideoxygalactose transaminase
MPFSRHSISEREIAAVADVMRSSWIATGTHTVEFKKTVYR